MKRTRKCSKISATLVRLRDTHEDESRRCFKRARCVPVNRSTAAMYEIRFQAQDHPPRSKRKTGPRSILAAFFRRPKLRVWVSRWWTANCWSRVSLPLDLERGQRANRPPRVACPQPRDFFSTQPGRPCWSMMVKIRLKVKEWRGPISVRS